MNIIKLTGITNLRDISYGNIKENKLFRSAGLDRTSEYELNILADEYHVKTIIDLRRPREIEKDSDVQIDKIKYINIPMVTKELFGEYIEMSKKDLINLYLNNRNIMNDLYADFFSDEKKEQWTKIFEILLDNENGAVLWHCKQGKDRTGIVAIVLLLAFGIPLETIKKDYMFTNAFFEDKIEKEYESALELGFNNEDAHFLAELYKAQESYFDSAINSLYDRYGTIEKFLNDVCNIDETKLNKLKEIYLNF